jgi:hypothetical protein
MTVLQEHMDPRLSLRLKNVVVYVKEVITVQLDQLAVLNYHAQLEDLATELVWKHRNVLQNVPPERYLN